MQLLFSTQFCSTRYMLQRVYNNYLGNDTLRLPCDEHDVMLPLLLGYGVKYIREDGLLLCKSGSSHLFVLGDREGKPEGDKGKVGFTSSLELVAYISSVLCRLIT